jgi:SAM-dependent methyltransferase
MKMKNSKQIGNQGVLLETLNDFLTSSDHFFKENGIWYAKTSGNVSFPQDAYDDLFRIEDISYWFRHRNNCILSLVKKYSNHELFLDIGGGNGVVAKALEDANIRSVLIEPGSKGVVNARQRKVQNILCAAMEDLALLHGKVSAVGAFDVIEHVEDDHQFVAEVNKLLRDNGFFYVTVPAYPFLWSDDDVYAGHYRRYRLKEVIGLLEKNNFEVVYSTYFFSILLLPLFVIRTIGSKSGLHKASVNTVKEHKQRKGITGRLLNIVWRLELARIQRLRYIPFGTSCLVIGKKK